MTDCKHADVQSTADGDSGAHIIVCTACHAITHLCLNPLYDRVEQDLEEVRRWGVHYAKASEKLSDGAILSKKVEGVLANLRAAMMESRSEKNMRVEAVAKWLEAREMPDAAKAVRALKLEVAVEP
jgi:hypothetical protein